MARKKGSRIVGCYARPGNRTEVRYVDGDGRTRARWCPTSEAPATKARLEAQLGLAGEQPAPRAERPAPEPLPEFAHNDWPALLGFISRAVEADPANDDLRRAARTISLCSSAAAKWINHDALAHRVDALTVGIGRIAARRRAN